MKADAHILQTLNQALRCELTAINQFFLHSRMLNNWGYEILGKMTYKQSIIAMKHADALIARIFFLEGLPNLQDLDKLLIGENVEEIIQCDLRFSQTQHQTQIHAIQQLEGAKDYVSRKLLRDQLAQTEEYIDALEEQEHLVHEIGLANYLRTLVKR